MVILLVIAVLVAMVVLGVRFMSTYKWDGLGVMMVLVGACCLLTIVLMWPCTYYGDMARVNEYHMTRQTIEASRCKEFSELERVQLTHKILETNNWIASRTYYNSIFLLDWFIPDEVATLEPLR